MARRAGPLLRREDLSEEEAGAAMGSVLAGEATPAQIAAFATGLRIKGETATEMTGLVKAMLAAAAPSRCPGRCSTPAAPAGTGVGTFNVSTLAALVAVGAGQRVAKHGNRAASAVAARLICWRRSVYGIPPATRGGGRHPGRDRHRFLLRPRVPLGDAPHRRDPAGAGRADRVQLPRPLTNPARAGHQALGVADPRLPIMAEVLRRTGVHHALVSTATTASTS